MIFKIFFSSYDISFNFPVMGSLLYTSSLIFLSFQYILLLYSNILWSDSLPSLHFMHLQLLLYYIKSFHVFFILHMEHYLDLVLFLLAQKLEENWHQSTILHFCTDFHQFLSRLFPGNSISWVSLHWLFHMNYTVFLFLKMGVATLSTWTAQWLMAFLWHWKTFHHVWWFSLASH